MFSLSVGLCLTILISLATSNQQSFLYSFRNEKVSHLPIEFNETQLSKLASLTNKTHMNAVLKKICIPRVVGTPNHKTVKTYLKNQLRSLDWTVESDVFKAKTPNLGILEFENIVAKLNPDARRYLVLACHYDSLYTKDGQFVGATDSAVPCAQLLNLATVMKENLESARTSNVSLMLVFFDGEEAFLKWGEKDSIYGARHLARKWHNAKRTYGYENDISDLDKMDMLVLLDLLGASSPIFYNYFQDTARWFFKLVDIEQDLITLRKLEKYPYNEKRDTLYFQSYPPLVPYAVEDDHIPFLKKNVPVLHLIPYKFPNFWHTNRDNLSIVDLDTTENLNKILRVFVASYLHLDV